MKDSYYNNTVTLVTCLIQYKLFKGADIIYFVIKPYVVINFDIAKTCYELI